MGTRKNSVGTGRKWKQEEAGRTREKEVEQRRREGRSNLMRGEKFEGRRSLARMIIHHHVRLWSFGRARPLHAPHYKLIVGVRDNHGR